MISAIIDRLQARKEEMLERTQDDMPTLLLEGRNNPVVPPEPIRASAQSLSEPNLMTLPTELRLEIYTHIFASETTRIDSSYALPGILTACRKTYTEAISLYYSLVTFHCLDEDSTVAWLTTLPEENRCLVKELRYDTRWMTFTQPYIPVPGAECWLYRNLMKRLELKGVTPSWKGRVWVSWYQGGEGGSIRWTDRPGLIEVVRPWVE